MPAGLFTRALSWFLAAGMLCALNGWADERDPSFRLGVIQERPGDPTLPFVQYGELLDYLSGRLGEERIRVAGLVVAEDIESMGARIARGEVDALIESLMPTLTLERQTGLVRPALLIWRKGQREYRSLFFARKDSPIQRLQDLNGRSIVFESERSTSAYFLPRVTLQAAGLKLLRATDVPPTAGEAVAYRFAGSELNQAYWVERGKADAGAFNDGDWERTPPSVRSSLRVFHRTEPVLRYLLSFDRRLDPGIRSTVIQGLLEMSASSRGRVALDQAARIVRFETLTDKDEAQLEHWRRVLGEPQP